MGRRLPVWFTILAALTTAARAADQPSPKPAKAVARPDYIDQMLQSSWDEAKVKPSPSATDAEYLRRAYLDLLGRIPTVQEASNFLETKDAGKRAKLVEYLLQSPDYPRNLGNVYSVLLLGRKMQERRVDRAALGNWLRKQFAENRPWDEMAYELITAKGNNKENGAANFTLAHLEGGAVPLTSITTRVFLGQQIQCTQCHDHPNNDWKQKDFWGINAFFKGVKQKVVMRTDSTGAEVEDHVDLSDAPTGAYSTFEKRNAYVEIAFPTYLDGRKIPQGPSVDRRVALGKFITDPNNDQFAKAMVNRMWAHLMGRGFVNPVDDFGAQTTPSHPELLDRLAADFKASGYDLRQLIRWIMASKPYNATSMATKANEKDESLFTHMALKPLSPEQLYDSLLVATEAHKVGSGDVDAQRKAWLDRFVVTFANDEDGETSAFQGTIPQALMMMNGELTQKATGGKAGSFLGKLIDQAQGAGPRAESLVVDRLFLAALSRHPSADEARKAKLYLDNNPDTLQVVEDLFWALLNSNEFALNH